MSLFGNYDPEKVDEKPFDGIECAQMRVSIDDRAADLLLTIQDVLGIIGEEQVQAASAKPSNVIPFKAPSIAVKPVELNKPVEVPPSDRELELLEEIKAIHEAA